jgi:hypothetical protein
MITTPIQFHVRRYGLGLFKGSAVFPYTYMSAEQRVWLHDVVRAIRTGGNHSALCRLNESLTYTIENDRIFFHTSGADQQQQQRPTRLAPTDVFDALLGAMAESKHTTPDRLQLLVGLLLQRIGCRVHVCRETLMHVQRRSAELFGPAG